MPSCHRHLRRPLYRLLPADIRKIQLPVFVILLPQRHHIDSGWLDQPLLSVLQPLQIFHGLRHPCHADDLDPPCHGSLHGIIPGQNTSSHPALLCPCDNRQNAPYRLDLSVQSQFPQQDGSCRTLLRKPAQTRQDPHRYRQIEHRPLLAQVRRGQIHVNAHRRQNNARVLQRNPHPLSRFPYLRT